MQGCVRSALPNETEQWSQELQLVIPGSRGISGIVGVYYADSDGELEFMVTRPLETPPLRENSHSTFSDPAAALFGQATARLCDRWSATAGVRLSREEHRMSSIGTGADDSPTLLVGEIESDDLSWRLDVSYAITDDAMAYASVSTGYKSGGFDIGLNTAGALDEFLPEELIALEAGGKTQWIDGRLTLNAAAFYYDFTDLQVLTAIFRRVETTSSASTTPQRRSSTASTPTRASGFPIAGLSWAASSGWASASSSSTNDEAGDIGPAMNWRAPRSGRKRRDRVRTFPAGSWGPDSAYRIQLPQRLLLHADNSPSSGRTASGC